MQTKNKLLPALILLTVCSTGNSHPPGEGEQPHDNAPQQEHSPFPSAVVLPNVDGPTPWSTKPVLNDPSRFQIAVVTDRTGGHRPGIWMKGVSRLNMLRPEFVVSVGDLIEGYTEDRPQVETEWLEFLGFIDQLDMKFFFVAGNHDLTNSMMHDVWRKHFGPEWYSFDYKGVHFLCLNSEDPSSNLGEEQLQWIERDLDQSKDARWTLIFVHKPLWSYADREKAAGNPDNTGWTRVEAILGDRPRTAFAGHHHSYVQFDRGGRKYYQLATMGGSSQMRGQPYGEFDHIVWLTMEANGPYVTNLILDGIQPDNVVTEESISRFRNFLAQSQLEIAPILIDDEAGFHSGRIDVRLTNRFEKPVEIRGRLDGIPLRGLTLDPSELTLRAEPGTTSELAMSLQFADKIEFSQLAGTVFTASLHSEETPPLAAERSIPVVIDRCHSVPSVTAPKIDGNLDDWSELRQVTTEQPLILGQAEYWSGPGDASLKFDVAHDAECIYVAARITDEQRYPGDRLEFVLDARPIAQRISDQRLLNGTYRIRVEAPLTTDIAGGDKDADLKSAPKATLRDHGDRDVKDKMIACAIATDAGYNVELAIPASLLKKQQGGDWHSFQMTAMVRDIDEEGQAPYRVLWRGTADVDTRNAGYGHFVPAAKK